MDLTQDQQVILIVGGVLIEGVILIILNYWMWKRVQDLKKEQVQALKDIKK